MTQRIVNLIKIRDNFFKLKKKFPNYNYANIMFKKYRNKVAGEIKNAKKQHCDEYFQANASNPRKTWTKLKSLLYNADASYNFSSVDLLMDNGIAITNTMNIDNKLNHFFANHPKSITNGINISTEAFHTYHSTESYDIPFSFSCPQCTEDEISLIIDNLSNSKATDFYGMSNQFLKIQKSQFLTILNKLINTSLTLGIFPDCLKVGVIKPILKSGNKTLKENYRPITILPVIGKIYEYVILLYDVLKIIYCQIRFSILDNLVTQDNLIQKLLSYMC